jgi:hypothetical protein
MGLFMVTAGIASLYAITTFGPKLSLQNRVKAIKAKMKEMMLARNIKSYHNQLCHPI